MGELSIEKATDLESMFKFMDETDVKYFQTIVKSKGKNKTSISNSTSQESRPEEISELVTSRPSAKKVNKRVKGPKSLI
jgi:hypothetical protein